MTATSITKLVGQHQIAINVVWTLFAGFLVMFMSIGLVPKTGAPLVPVALGVSAAAFVNWKTQRRG